MRCYRISARVTRFFVVFTLTGWCVASAEVRVLDSSVPEVRKGATLKDDTIIVVPSGSRLHVLIMPKGVTVNIIGPYNGRVHDYRGNQPLVGKHPHQPVGGAAGVK